MDKLEGKKKCKKCEVEYPKTTEFFRKRPFKLKSGKDAYSYRSPCKKCIYKYSANWGKNNKDKLSIYYKNYKDKNYEKIKVFRNKYKQRPYVKIARRVRKSLHRHVKDGSFSITLKTLPYSMRDLKEHIENQFKPWMNWDNWGSYKLEDWDDNDKSTWTWQIDHIKPLSSFDIQKFGDEEFIKAWAKDNLRPLNAKQNIIEGARLPRS